jgi:adenylosuccinate lyase
MTEFDTYVSPYSWRYGGFEIRKIWSEVHKRKIWRQLWVDLAETQLEFCVVEEEQVKDINAHKDDIDIRRSLEIESQIHHDLMAEITTFAEQCEIGGGIIHLGATSSDIKDNTTVIQIKESLDLVSRRLRNLLIILSNKVIKFVDTPIIAFTHLQPAEPSTLGYRLAQYTQDMVQDWENINQVLSQIRGKGFKGAVGTSASFSELLGVENINAFENILSKKIDLEFYPVTTQTYPRQQEYQILSVLAGLGASLHKFAFDLRILQSPSIGELSEAFGDHQVGSSAMPFKRNPINSEKIVSLARLLAQFPRTAWDNAANSLLERTLDDSANRRTLLPEAFLITDELLRVGTSVVDGFVVDKAAIKRNLAAYGPFAATERVLVALSKAGAHRQMMHERLRQHSLFAWESIRNGNRNPLAKLIATDPVFLKFLSKNVIYTLMDYSDYLGDAPQRAKAFALSIQAKLN